MSEQNGNEVLTVDELDARSTLRVKGVDRFSGLKDDVNMELLPASTQDLGEIIAKVNDLIQRVSSIQGTEIPVLVEPPTR